VRALDRLELLDAPREAVGDVEVAELIRREPVEAAEPSRLRPGRAPAIEEIPVEIELEDSIRAAVAGPDEALVVDEVIRHERRLTRGPMRRAQRPHRDEFAVGVEHLHALVAAVDDEQAPVLGYSDAVDSVELVRSGMLRVLWRLAPVLYEV